MSTVQDRPTSPSVPSAGGLRRVPLVAGLVLALALLGGVVGYTAADRGGTRLLHGTVYVGADQASVKVGRTYYAVPLSVSWRDTHGTWHEDGRPACLGSPGQSTAITFGAVEFKREGLRTRTVVWVDCSRQG